ncbi:VOC family protein [Ramlibacter sp.]|uniref:VOC family protein n=1 Tax=Ramlibacter sp. TaxID=1917967 RepID=UPI0025DC6E7F|nr:VOC family protein [Ramlibacter sp.]
MLHRGGGGAGATAPKIVPCLWFDGQGEEAAKLYTGIFPQSRITHVSRYTEAGQEFHRQPPGSVMTVSFELAGQAFLALNGGPMFKFNEAVSLQVMCDAQDEVDHYWNALTPGGDPQAQRCGWLKDRFGLSWQVTPNALAPLLEGEPASAGRAFGAMMTMKKLDIAALQRAFDGK